MFDIQIRGKFMEIWVKNRRHHHILRLISDSSVSWRLRGRGCVFLGFGVSSRESQPSSERMLTELTTPIAFVYAPNSNF